MASSINTTKEIATEIFPLIRVYKDGTVERIILSPYVPPDSSSPTAAVSSKDITISTDVSARLYLPNLTTTTEPKKLPILVYFHGGGFLIESAFSFVHHRFMTALVSESKAIALSVEYRLAPEHPLPAAYHDCWAALKWVVSNFSDDHDGGKEPWLIDHGDRNRLFIGGDSAGANIAHNIAMRLGNESLSGSGGGGGVKILGAFLTHPYFWGSEPVGSEPNPLDQNCTPHRVWMLVYPDAPGGIDNLMINPFVEGAPSLSGLLGGGNGGRRLLVGVAEKDELRERGVWYYHKVKESGWEGDSELFEMEGEGHAFHVLDTETANAKRMIKLLASFINS